MLRPCCGGKATCDFNKLASDIHAAGGLDAWGKAAPKRMVFVKAMAPSPAEIHAAAVRRLAAISASATELARQGKLSSHEAGVLDHLIGIHGQRLEIARPRR